MSRRTLLHWIVCLAASLAACGGGAETSWDPLQPRDATVQDLTLRRFTFTGFRYGEVFHPTLATTPTVLEFGAATAASCTWQLPVALEAGGRASGLATLDGQVLSLRFDEGGAGQPFRPGDRVDFDVRADVDDGRISLRNRASGVEQTSAP